MRRTDVGDHRHVRGSGAAQAFNFTKATHAHLDDHSPVFVACVEEGEWNANVVVLIATARLNRTQGQQG